MNVTKYEIFNIEFQKFLPNFTNELRQTGLKYITSDKNLKTRNCYNAIRGSCKMAIFVQLTLAFSNHLNDKHTDTDIMTNVESTTPAGGI